MSDKGQPRVMRAVRNPVEMKMVDLDGTLAEDHRARALWTLLDTLDVSRFMSA